MTRIKVIAKDVIIKDVKKMTSKRGNDYSVLVVEIDGKEVNLYNPSDFNFEVNHVYDLDLEVIISKYSSIKVLNAHEVKKGLFK